MPQNARGALLTSITLEQLYVIQRGRVEQGNPKKILVYFTQQIQHFGNRLMKANKNNRGNIHELIFCSIQNKKKSLVGIDDYKLFFGFCTSEHRTLLSLKAINTVSTSLSCFKSIH